MVRIELRDGRTAVLSRATERDAPAFLTYLERIGGESDFLSFGPGEGGFTLEQELEYLKAFADPATGVALKAELDGRFVGSATIVRGSRPRFRHGGTLGVSTLRETWGLGLGRALCKAVIEEARAIGLRRVTLSVRSDNARAIGLYESLGFRHEGRLRGAFAIGDVEYDDLVMGLYPLT
ncbi:MAG TPA: GNAT family N-acetyltransferase [Polyangiaceae bacterium]